LLIQVVVDRDDPAFSLRSKPIGPLYDRAQADAISAARGWSMRPDGDHWRRVVPPPEPQRIVELETIARLADAAVLGGLRRRRRCTRGASRGRVARGR